MHSKITTARIASGFILRALLALNRLKPYKKSSTLFRRQRMRFWSQGLDLNQPPSGYESQAGGSVNSPSSTSPGCTEQAFYVFSHLHRSVGICFFCISKLVLEVVWQSQCRPETVVENRVEGNRDAKPCLHQS